MARHESFTSLAFALDDVAGGLEKNAAKIVRDVAGSVHEVVIERTPVDTTRAVSNWILTIGPRANYTRAPFVPGKKGSTAFESRAYAIDQGRQRLRGYDNPERPVNISNNLHYIRKLNQGSSRQAPAGFVEASIAAGVSSLRGARLLSRR